MRQLLFALPLMLVAAPAVGQPRPASEAAQIPPELADPALADKLTRVSGTLAQALMNLPVGEMEAAMEGRTPTQADRRKRVRDEIGPDGERQLMAEVATAGPRMRAMQKALVSSLPTLMGALGQVEQELERAVANIPDPTYPRR
jgi:hypothetical protein